MFHVSILMLMLMLQRFLRRCHIQLYIVGAGGRRHPPFPAK
jgi:hypothetical protein